MLYKLLFLNNNLRSLDLLPCHVTTVGTSTLFLLYNEIVIIEGKGKQNIHLTGYSKLMNQRPVPVILSSNSNVSNDLLSPAILQQSLATKVKNGSN